MGEGMLDAIYMCSTLSRSAFYPQQCQLDGNLASGRHSDKTEVRGHNRRESVLNHYLLPMST
jgi:hypothetical protein